jgi:hypothetical protein
MGEGAACVTEGGGHLEHDDPAAGHVLGGRKDGAKATGRAPNRQWA